MLLAVDAGNTNIVFAAYEAGRIVAQWRMSTERRRTADEYAVWLRSLMQLHGLEFSQIKAGIIATVVPQALFALRMLFRHYFATEALVVGEAGVRTGMIVDIDRPAEIGADRLVNAVAAWEKYRRALIIIDFGTATTFDAVSAEGHYIGGAIAPGINLSMEALHRAAAKLPNVAIARPERVIGRNTEQAMQSGMFWGYIGAIEGMIARIRAEYGAPMFVTATGGLAPLFASGTPVIEAQDPDLTIAGLQLIYTRNARSPEPDLSSTRPPSL